MASISSSFSAKYPSVTSFFVSSVAAPSYFPGVDSVSDSDSASDSVSGSTSDCVSDSVSTASVNSSKVTLIFVSAVTVMVFSYISEAFKISLSVILSIFPCWLISTDLISYPLSGDIFKTISDCLAHSIFFSSSGSGIS